MSPAQTVDVAWRHSHHLTVCRSLPIFPNSGRSQGTTAAFHSRGSIGEGKPTGHKAIVPVANKLSTQARGTGYRAFGLVSDTLLQINVANNPKP
jgi:hypothetical protein